MRLLMLTLLVSVVAASPADAAIIQDDFSTDPAAKGWHVFGNTNLFQWDNTNQNLRVTWDSSQTNSYFYHPLGTILARGDDFSLQFDLNFQDYTSDAFPGLIYGFPASIGFLNLDNATQTNFSRGAGVNLTYGAKNLVEFAFFPSFAGFQPTISQVIVSTNNTWLYNHDNLREMTPGELFHVAMDYSGVTGTLITVVTSNGVQYGDIQLIQVTTNFDFRVAAISVSSYSHQYSGGSILAHGTVDNFVVTVPPPPILNLTGMLTDNIWRVQFASRSNWLYTLECSADFQSWTNVSASISGNGTNLFLQDASPPLNRAFYRVRASRP